VVRGIERGTALAVGSTRPGGLLRIGVIGGEALGDGRLSAVAGVAGAGAAEPVISAGPAGSMTGSEASG
jgi:hypothetical protein